LEGKKAYFASDFHLGLSAGTNPRKREERVVAWLRTVSPDASEIYLLGDLFDFWWEYKSVIPRGFSRFLGTLSSLTDSGIKVHVFTGNHDLWMKEYLAEECGVLIHHGPFVTTIGNELFYLAHGEGLGSKSKVFKFLLGFFHNRAAQWLFSFLHPRIGMGIGHSWSNSSRLAKHVSLPFLGEDKEDLIRHTRQLISEGCEARYFIYGHRHLPLTFDESERRMIILGDWFSFTSYAVYDGLELRLVSDPYVTLP
jgi:UDP-2,3-diacylglucosamine hydrolase